MIRPLSIAILVLACALPVQADELIYEPVNPAFGGDPENGIWLLRSAEIQNKHEDDGGGGSRTVSDGATQTELDRLNELLQRSILSRLASAATSSIIGDNNELQPGTIETTDFIIDIVDGGAGNLIVTTTDKATGATTSFEVDSNL